MIGATAAYASTRTRPGRDRDERLTGGAAGRCSVDWMTGTISLSHQRCAAHVIATQ
jgi:hypothetical protein